MRKLQCFPTLFKFFNITFALFILCFLHIAKMKTPVINRAKMKWRSFDLVTSPVSFCFSRQTWHQLLRRKDMSIPGSGERKPVVMMTSSAVRVLCFTIRFLFLCSSVLVSLFGIASYFFLTLFSYISLYAIFCLSSSLPSTLPLSVFLFCLLLPFSSVPPLVL